jgi:DNA-binding NtrC family response regulator
MEDSMRRVLLIDDEKDILEVVGYFLKKDGYLVTVAESGAEALEIMGEQSFDVVICDYLMPKMDGIALLQKVREKKDYTSFIFFSGNANENHEVKMVGLGAYQLVQKNDFKKLPDAIKRTLKHTQELQDIGKETTEEMDEFLSILHSTK